MLGFLHHTENMSAKIAFPIKLQGSLASHDEVEDGNGSAEAINYPQPSYHLAFVYTWFGGWWPPHCRMGLLHVEFFGSSCHTLIFRCRQLWQPLLGLPR